MNKLNSNGFTLVEVIVAILITGIIAAAISSYLVVHIKTYETTKDLINVQYNAQVVLNEMSEIAMESKGIYKIMAGNTDLIDSTMANEPSLLIFKSQDSTGDIYHIFTKDLTASDGVMKYIDTSSIADPITYINSILPNQIIGDEFATTIDKMTILPGKSGETFDECDSIQIILQLKDGGASLDVKKVVKFRNKK